MTHYYSGVPGIAGPGSAVPGDPQAPVPSPQPTVSATAVGYYGYAAGTGFYVPIPATSGVACSLTAIGMTPGDWLVAVVTIRQPFPSWTVTTTATGTTTTFLVSTSAAGPIYAGDQFTGPVNTNGSYLYYVTEVSLPASGNVTVTFTPAAASTVGSSVKLTQTGVTASVADDAHNWWFPVGTTSCTSSAAGVTRTMIWAAPAARLCSWVVATPAADCQAITLVVYDVSGLSPYATVVGNTTGYANAAESISGSLSGPGQDAWIITASGSDDLAYTISLGSGDGWGNVFTLTEDNGVDHTSDIQSSSAWQVTSSSTVANWSSTGDVDFSLAMAAISVNGTAPAQSNPNWPYVITEIALGAGPGTPQDQLVWMPLNQPGGTRSRVLAANLTQGKQYMLDQLQAGQGSMVLDDPDLALIPPGSGSFAGGIDSGTPVRMRMVWAGGSWQLEFSGNGSTGNPQVESSSNQVPVSPGVTYSTAAWLACSAIFTVTGLRIGIVWKTAAGSTISTTYSSVVTGTVPAVMVATGAAPANAAYADVVIQAEGTPHSSISFYAAAAPAGSLPLANWIVMPADVAWATENGAGVTATSAWTPDRRGAPAVSPWFIPISAYFQRWPPSWDPDTFRGQTQTTIADIWAYCNRQLKSGLRQEMLQDSPYAYWPLTDAAGAMSASNIAPGNTNTLNVTLSKNGAGAATQAFGQNSGALAGDTTTTITTSQRSSDSTGMWGQSGVSVVTEGYTLLCTDPGFPSVANGVTITGFFNIQGVVGTDSATIFTCQNSSNGVFLQLYAATDTGYPTLNWKTTTGGTGSATIISASIISADNYMVTVSFNTTNWTVTFDGGAYVATGTFTGGGTLPAQFTTITINGSTTVTQAGSFYNGYSGHWAIYPYVVQPARIVTWYYMGLFAFGATQDGETDDKRVARLLGYTGLPGPRCILQGQLAPNGNYDATQVVSVQDIGGQPASTSLTNLNSSTVPSQLYVAPNGDIVYRQKTFTYNQPVMWVLGDNPAAGEIPMETDYAPDYDPARVVNDIAITQLDDQSVTVPDIPQTELLSITQYGDQTYQITGYVQNDLLSTLPIPPGVPDLANWIAEVGARPRLRVAQVTVDASSHPSAWSFALQAASGDVATVNIRPATSGGQLVSITGRITQTQRTFTFGTQTVATIQCLIDLAPEINALTCDSATFGLLNGTNCLGW